jgi:hypothetical protein
MEDQSIRRSGLAQQGESLALQREQEQRIAEAQRAQMADMENQRQFGRASTIAENAMPDDAVDEPTRALLTAQGFGGQMRSVPGVLMQGPMGSGDQRSEMDREAELGRGPDGMVMRGGARYLNAAAEREARTETADANREAQNDRAEADRQMRQMIAGLAASNSAESKALANELKALQIRMMGDKVDAAQTDKEKAAQASRTTTESALATARRMATHPGLTKASGVVSSRLSGMSQDAADFDAMRDQLVAALAQPNLGALKGPMSDKDILFIKSLATRLSNTRMSDAETRTALAEAVTFLENKAGDGAKPASGFKVVGVR